MNTRQPMSKLEKLYDGLRILKQYQPAAKIDAVQGEILVGDTDDKHVSMGARNYLSGLGFVEDKERKVFVFPTRKK